MEMSQKRKTKKSSTKQSSTNGKGDSPRSIFSKKYKSNYDSINWSIKKS